MIKAITVLLAASFVAAPVSAGVNDRQEHQRDRIVQGWQSGELTRGEARKLGHQQQHIARAEARMRADGGGLNHAERARLHVRQERVGARIHGKKHNGRQR